MAKKKQQKNPDDNFRVAINGHELVGVKNVGEWTFTCPSWPEIAKRWSGDTILTNAIEDFMSRALVGVVNAKAAFGAMQNF